MVISIRNLYNNIYICFCNISNKHCRCGMLAIFKDHIRRSYNFRNIFSILFVIRPMAFQNVQNTFIRQNDIWAYFFPNVRKQPGSE